MLSFLERFFFLTIALSFGNAHGVPIVVIVSDEVPDDFSIDTIVLVVAFGILLRVWKTIYAEGHCDYLSIGVTEASPTT